MFIIDLIKNILPKPKKPTINDNTFILWEPCSKSHAEIIPGYTKYLLDCGYDVSIMMACTKYQKGLFSKFANNDRVHINKFSMKEACKYFQKYGLNGAKGVLITTARRLSMYKGTYEPELKLFKEQERKRVFMVDHDINTATDSEEVYDEIITLFKPNYKNVKTTVINPHYFGEIKVTPKNKITNFIMIGALREKQRNCALLVNTIKNLIKSNYKDFKITVIGKGSLRDVPEAITEYIDIKGQVDFETLYNELEKADFFLPMLDEENIDHERYITTGTSGSFQLVYGFTKPCLIVEKFTKPHGFDIGNSIIYPRSSAFMNAMIEAINMSEKDYENLQQNLSKLSKTIYDTSLENMKKLVL